MGGVLVDQLAGQAARAGLGVLAAGRWPEQDGDVLPKVAGFVHSPFNPLVVAAAERCLGRLPSATPRPVTAVLLASALGDVDSAVHVAATVDAGTRVGPLFFFQSVPNAAAGYSAARWGLTQPVACGTATVGAR